MKVRLLERLFGPRVRPRASQTYTIKSTVIMKPRLRMVTTYGSTVWRCGNDILYVEGCTASEAYSKWMREYDAAVAYVYSGVVCGP